MHKTCNPCRQATAYRCPHFDRVDRQAMTITATSDSQILKSNIRNWAIGLQTFATGSLPRSGLVQRQLWNIKLTVPDHCSLIPANLTTLAHFSVSAAMNFPSSSGAIGISTTPTSASRDFAFASASAALISLLSLSMISIGVFFGAPTPNHPLAS